MIRAVKTMNFAERCDASRLACSDGEVRVAPDEVEAMNITNVMVVDNIKKGWTKVVSVRFESHLGLDWCLNIIAGIFIK